MRSRMAIGATVATIAVGSVIVRSIFQAPAVRPVDEKVLREYAGAYQLQYDYLRMGKGWDQYAAMRERLAARMGGNPPEAFPATPDHPYLQFIRPLVLYDPAPTIRQLRLPVLALFGELDNNIMAEKNRAAWEAALAAGGHGDYTLRILPKANHALLEAKSGHNAEMKSLQRLVPEYFQTVQDWLARRKLISQLSHPLAGT